KIEFGIGKLLVKGNSGRSINFKDVVTVAYNAVNFLVEWNRAWRQRGSSNRRTLRSRSVHMCASWKSMKKPANRGSRNTLRWMIAETLSIRCWLRDRFTADLFRASDRRFTRKSFTM